MDQVEFSRKYKDSPIKRAKLVGLKRNACIALGNNGDIRSLSALSYALKTEDSLVRSHAAWALGRIGGKKAVYILENALNTEKDSETYDEIRLAIEEAKVNLYKVRKNGR